MGVNETRTQNLSVNTRLIRADTPDTRLDTAFEKLLPLLGQVSQAGLGGQGKRLRSETNRQAIFEFICAITYQPYPPYRRTCPTEGAHSIPGTVAKTALSRGM